MTISGDVSELGNDAVLEWDLYYQLGTGPEVPVPATAWLFGSALAGLGVVRRKKHVGNNYNQ